MYATAPGNETFIQIFIFRGRVETCKPYTLAVVIL